MPHSSKSQVTLREWRTILLSNPVARSVNGFASFQRRRTMTNLRTKDSLLRALEKASARAPTAEELRKQRVSFIMGSLKESSGVTRARVEQVLAEQEGERHRE